MRIDVKEHENSSRRRRKRRKRVEMRQQNIGVRERDAGNEIYWLNDSVMPLL